MTKLKATSRSELGKKVKTLRRAGFLPAVVYGEGVTPQPISVLAKDFGKVYKEVGESSVFTLDVAGKQINVLIHEIKYDPLKGVAVHADFYAVRMDKEIKIKVPIAFLGESPAVKNEGGILVKVMQEIEVEALPNNLPHELQANLATLKEFESKLYVKDIVLPRGVKIVTGEDEVVALVETPRSEEELQELSETPTAEVKEVKTEQEVKKAEEAKKETEEKTE